MSPEQNLLDALKYLDSLMVPDEKNPEAGSGITMGLSEFLQKHNCKMVTYLGQVLKRDGYVSVVKQGRHNVLFWNKSAKPNMGMAKNIVEETRKMKTEKRANAVAETISPDQRNNVIRSLIDDARLKKAEYQKKMDDLDKVIMYFEGKL